MAQPTQRRRIRRSSLDGLARGRLDYLKADLAVFGFNSSGPIVSADMTSVDDALNEVTYENTLGITQNGSIIILTSTGTLPSPLEPGVLYYVRNSGEFQFEFYNSKEDAINDVNIIDLADVGSGTHTIYKL